MTGLTPRAARRTAKTVRTVARQPRNLVGQRIQTYPASGKGGGKCAEVDCLNIFGPVSGGTVSLAYTIDSTTESIVLNWNDSASTVQTAFEGHSKVNPGDVDVLGGPWPSVALHVVFIGGLGGKPVPFPTATPSLTGTGVNFRMWKASSADWKGY